MVNTCDFCGQPVKRHLFCSASCKVRYHRGDKPKTTIDTALNTPQAVKEAIKPTVYIDPTPVTNNEQPQFSDIKKPGYHLVAYLGKYVKD